MYRGNGAYYWGEHLQIVIWLVSLLGWIPQVMDDGGQELGCRIEYVAQALRTVL